MPRNHEHEHGECAFYGSHRHLAWLGLAWHIMMTTAIAAVTTVASAQSPLLVYGQLNYCFYARLPDWIDLQLPVRNSTAQQWWLWHCGCGCGWD